MKYFLLGALALLMVSCSQLPEAGSGVKREPPPELLDFTWLVGSWRDQSDLVDVYITWHWDEEGHFLEQKFRVEGEGDKVFSGKQILGWDPEKKEVRSWIFDSAGGFGQSEWHREGDTWYAETIYTTGEGKRATATHVYKKIDDHSYTFSSENRDIAGSLMPNLGPFKMVKS